MEVTEPLQEALVRNLESDELVRAFSAATGSLIREVRIVNPELGARLKPTLRALTAIPG